MQTGGDGGLDLTVEIKQWQKLDKIFETKEEAEQVAFVHEEVYEWETNIAPHPNGGWILWYRN